MTEASLSGAGLSIVAALAMVFLFGMVSFRWISDCTVIFRFHFFTLVPVFRETNKKWLDCSSVPFGDCRLKFGTEPY